ncbi:hypothetical protein BLNAU_16467 [Blattamonas nauphoetae]|uniref:SPRY domain-containing protein n=1 Tax=Blattamonas nauphoetae TaxID=2049346 RepID=A0ABQ9X8D6_9EUKA|nr:hypothetical protein BLNAU_16467 [Blattamonas nauphoetae]
MESVLEWLSDSSVHPRNKVNSFQWFHIPTLLTTHIQSQPTKQNNELFSQLLQRMMTILDECFDCHTPIANKRLLHSSLSQLSQSPSLSPSIKRDVEKCFASLKFVEEGPFAIVEASQLDLMESKDRTIAEMKEQLTKQQQLNQYEHLLAMRAKKEGELAELLVEEQSVHWQMWALQMEKVQILKEREWQRRELALKTQKLEENERVIGELKQEIQQLKAEVARKEPIVASDVIVAVSLNQYQMHGWKLTRINADGYAGCFTKPFWNGIHRMSIKTETRQVNFGVIDAAESPQFLTKMVHNSPKAALMSNNGWLFSAGRSPAQNPPLQKGQEWSAEADLEKRTLHFFVDGIQQQHHFTNIPVPLVFAIDVHSHGTQVEITFWGETQSHVTFEGTGHNLG